MDRFSDLIPGGSPKDVATPKVSSARPLAPTLDERFQGATGLDPTLRRGTILPLADNPKTGKTEFAWPQIAVDIMKGAMLPSHVAKGGSYSPDDVTRMAMDVGPVGAVRGAKPVFKRRDVLKNAPTKDDLARESGRLYDEVGAKGIVIPGGDAMRLVADLNTTLGKEGADQVLHPKAVGIMERWTAKTGNARDLDFDELEIMRKQAGTVAKSLDPSEARLGVMMKDSIDDYVDKIPDAAGIKKARALWRRKSKAQDLEELFFKAELSASGFENGLRNGFRALLKNQKVRRGYNKAEIKAMEHVVNGGSVQSFLRTVRHLGPGTGAENRFLGSTIGIVGGGALGSAIGGPLGAAVGGVGVPAVGHLAGRLAERNTINAGKLAQALVASGNIPSVDTLGAMLMRHGARRLPGPILGAQPPERK